MSKKVGAGTQVRMTVAEKEYLLKRIQEEHQTTLNGTSHRLSTAKRQADAALRADLEEIPEKIGIPELVEEARKLIVAINKKSSKLYGRDIVFVLANKDKDVDVRYVSHAPREKNDQGEVTAYGKLAEAAYKKHQAPVLAVQEQVKRIAQDADAVLRETKDQIMFSSNPDAMAGFLNEYKSQALKTRLLIEQATAKLPMLTAGGEEAVED